MILDKLQEIATGSQRREELWGPPLKATVSEHETGGVEPMGFATRREYALSATVVATYWANQAQRSEARKVAERALVQTLYGDVLAKLAHIEHAVMDSDGRRAMQHCGELRELLTR